MPSTTRAADACLPDTHPWQSGYTQALDRYQRQEWGQALALVLPLAQQWPDASDVQNLAAVLLAVHRRFGEAIAVWQKCCRHSRTMPMC